jgi:hypothetical protein
MLSCATTKAERRENEGGKNVTMQARSNRVKQHARPNGFCSETTMTGKGITSRSEGKGKKKSKKQKSKKEPGTYTSWNHPGMVWHGMAWHPGGAGSFRPNYLMMDGG